MLESKGVVQLRKLSPMPVQILVEKKKLKHPPLNVHTLGDRILRQPAKRVSKIDDELRQLAIKMLQTMYSMDGVGLAAPQIGLHKQLIVVDPAPENAATPPLILINPEIRSLSPVRAKDQEGCLSVPGVYMDVERPEAIVVAYKDENGRPCKLETDGFLARVIQHEMDHLRGVLFVDHINDSLSLTKELQKQGFSIHAVQPVA
jgi:peptide deformylase